MCRAASRVAPLLFINSVLTHARRRDFNERNAALAKQIALRERVRFVSRTVSMVIDIVFFEEGYNRPNNGVEH
jgi:hypothetical protein